MIQHYVGGRYLECCQSPKLHSPIRLPSPSTDVQSCPYKQRASPNSLVRCRVQMPRCGRAVAYTSQKAVCRFVCLNYHTVAETAFSKRDINSFARRSGCLIHHKSTFCRENLLRLNPGDWGTPDCYRPTPCTKSPIQFECFTLVLVEVQRASLTTSWNPLQGTRVGEAQDPGPGNQVQYFVQYSTLLPSLNANRIFLN